MPLSAANVIQAKTDKLSASTAPVVLDAGTRAGSTVTVEIYADSVPIMDGGIGGRIPDGFEFDASSVSAGSPDLHVFRKRNVAAGEGVAGSTPWNFTYITALNWIWRVTEWDTGLEPVYPLEARSHNTATGTSPTTLSTGTTPQTSRGDLVCLAWHQWVRNANTAQSMTWSGHTNGFTERDAVRWTMGTSEYGISWSWLFAEAAGQFETTATINLATRAAADLYFALLVVYAATTYA